jgi:hypothetical protein
MKIDGRNEKYLKNNFCKIGNLAICIKFETVTKFYAVTKIQAQNFSTCT